MTRNTASANAIPGAGSIIYPAMGHEIPGHLYGELAGEIRALAAPKFTD